VSAVVTAPPPLVDRARGAATAGRGATASGLIVKPSTVGGGVSPIGATGGFVSGAGIAMDAASLSADRLPAASRARTWYEYVVPGAVVVSV
jgi:hypothetical protein